MSLLDNQSIGLPCPKCGHKTPKTVAWVKAHDSFACDGCGATVGLDTDKLVQGLGEFDKSVANFKRRLGRLNKR